VFKGIHAGMLVRVGRQVAMQGRTCGHACEDGKVGGMSCSHLLEERVHRTTQLCVIPRGFRLWLQLVHCANLLYVS